MNSPNSHSSSRKRRRSSRSRRSTGSSSRQPIAELGTALEPTHPFDMLLLRCVDLGFATLILVLPFLMGGREGLGQLTLVLTACWIALCWGWLQFRQRTNSWALSAAEPLLIAGITLVALQVIRLPPEMLNRISPELSSLLPAWSDSGVFSVWDRVSIVPVETIDSLMVLIAYVVIFVVALQRIRTQKDVFRMLTALAIAAGAMAAFGLAQYALSNGRFFWIYQNPYTGTDSVAKGAFTNRNHFASFLALGIGPLVWCLVAASLRARTNDSSINNTGGGMRVAIIVVAISVVIFAALLSLSRGGAIALAVACVVSGIALSRSAVVSGQLAFGSVCVLVLTCGLMVVYGQDRIQKRLDQIVSADAEQLDSSEGRRAIWKANLEGIQQFPIAGTGAGSHREVYPIYMEDSGADHRNEFTHAENGYLQVGLETGLTGLVLLCLCFVLSLCWTLSGLFRRDRPLITAAQAAALSCLLVSLVHSGTDFVWYVPACVIPVILMAASACRLRQLQRAADGRQTLRIRVPAFSGPLVSAGALALAVWMVPAKYRRMEAQHHWYKYLHISLQSDEPTPTNRSGMLRNRLIAVSRTIAADPTQARPHVRMATLCMQAFEELQAASENRMSLGMIRDAALSNPWATRQEMDEWLDRVLEERGAWLQKALHHTRETLRLSPLQGRGYLYMAELGFLDEAVTGKSSEMIEQALLVRPHHPQVLFAAGREKLIAGEGPEAIALWKRTFNLSRRYQTAILSQMAMVVSAPELVATFDPDAEALSNLIERYRALGYVNDMQYSMHALVESCMEMADDATVPRERSIRYLLIARRVCDELNQPEQARSCFARAVDLSPQDYRTHYQFGVWLAEREEYTAAADEFLRCSEIRPGDSHTRRLVTTMRRKGLDAQLRPGSGLATRPKRQL